VREVLTDAQRPLAMRRPQDHDVADATVDQLHPPQYERTHEYVAQLGIGLDEGQQVVAIDLDDLAVRTSPDLGERGAAREHRDFAGEHPRAERHYDLLDRP